jgi:hypothetical protein
MTELARSGHPTQAKIGLEWATGHLRRLQGTLSEVKLGARVGLYMKGPIPLESASAFIDNKIKELGDWRGETLAHVRRLVHDADPDIQEEWKWVKPTSPGTPVFSHDGGVCTGESHKQVVKLTFFRGASIQDPKKLFNSSLEGNMRRAIDIREGEKIDEAAFRQLIRAAVAANSAARAPSSKKLSSKKPSARKK